MDLALALGCSCLARRLPAVGRRWDEAHSGEGRRNSVLAGDLTGYCLLIVTVGIDTNSLQMMACLSPPHARQLLRPARASRRSFIFITLFAQTNQATMVRNYDMIISARAGEGCCCSHRWNNDASHIPLWDSDLHYCRGL